MKSTKSGLKWFLVQLKPNSFSKAQRNLRQQGFDTFMPLEERTLKRQGRYLTIPQPLFPGYIFVATDVILAGWSAVNSTYGVTRLVSFGKEPEEVPLELVLQLRHHCDANGILLPSSCFKVGDKTTVKKGPFTNFITEVEKVSPDRRIWVLMDIMGGKRKIEFRPDELKKTTS